MWKAYCVFPHILKYVPHILKYVPHIFKYVPHTLNYVPHTLKYVPNILKYVSHILKYVLHILKYVPKYWSTFPTYWSMFPYIEVCSHILKYVPTYWSTFPTNWSIFSIYWSMFPTHWSMFDTYWCMFRTYWSMPPHIKLCSPHIEVCSPHTEVFSPYIELCSPHTEVCSTHIEVSFSHTEVCSPPIEVYSHILKYVPHILKYVPHILKYVPHILWNVTANSRRRFYVWDWYYETACSRVKSAVNWVSVEKRRITGLQWVVIIECRAGSEKMLLWSDCRQGHPRNWLDSILEPKSRGLHTDIDPEHSGELATRKHVANYRYRATRKQEFKMRSALFWIFTQRIVTVPYRRFGTICRSRLQGQINPRNPRSGFQRQNVLSRYHKLTYDERTAENVGYLTTTSVVGKDWLTLENGTDRLPWNVGKELPLYGAWWHTSAQFWVLRGGRMKSCMVKCFDTYRYISILAALWTNFPSAHVTDLELERKPI